jgi:transcriptional regulator with XRE-family HTH domain
MRAPPREAGFGKRLRERRMERHLLQIDLAQQMTVPQAYISRWEAGYFEYMTLDRLRTLKRILGISLDELVGPAASSPSSPAEPVHASSE